MTFTSITSKFQKFPMTLQFIHLLFYVYYDFVEFIIQTYIYYTKREILNLFFILGKLLNNINNFKIPSPIKYLLEFRFYFEFLTFNAFFFLFQYLSHSACWYTVFDSKIPKRKVSFTKRKLIWIHQTADYNIWHVNLCLQTFPISYSDVVRFSGELINSINIIWIGNWSVPLWERKLVFFSFWVWRWCVKRHIFRLIFRIANSILKYSSIVFVEAALSSVLYRMLAKRTVLSLVTQFFQLISAFRNFWHTAQLNSFVYVNFSRNYND